MAETVRIERDGVTLTTTPEAAASMATAGWQPVKPAPRPRKTK